MHQSEVFRQILPSLDVDIGDVLFVPDYQLWRVRAFGVVGVAACFAVTPPIPQLLLAPLIEEPLEAEDSTLEALSALRRNGLGCFVAEDGAWYITKDRHFARQPVCSVATDIRVVDVAGQEFGFWSRSSRDIVALLAESEVIV